MNKRRFKGGFLTIIGMVIAVAIVCILFYFVAKTYLMRPKDIDQQTAQDLHKQGIDSTNYRTIIDSTRKTVGDLKQQQQDRIRQLEDMY
jgi:hypothetical protein